MCAVRPEQAPGLLDDPAKDDLRLAQRGDAGRDVAERPLRLGPGRKGRLRTFQLLDQPRVGDRDRGLVGKPAEDLGVDLVERVVLVLIDLDGAERALVADDRRDDQVADPGRACHLVGRVDVDELAGQVVAGRDDPSLRHGLARQAFAEVQTRGAHRRPLLVAQPGVVDRDQDVLLAVELVDHRAVGTEQAAGLVDDALEQVAGLPDRGDPGGDLAQRPFRLGSPLDDRPRSGQFLDEACIADRDRGLGGERREHLAIGLVVGPRLA